VQTFGTFRSANGHFGRPSRLSGRLRAQCGATASQWSQVRDDGPPHRHQGGADPPCWEVSHPPPALRAAERYAGLTAIGQESGGASGSGTADCRSAAPRLIVSGAACREVTGLASGFSNFRFSWLTLDLPLRASPPPQRRPPRPASTASTKPARRPGSVCDRKKADQPVALASGAVAPRRSRAQGRRTCACTASASGSTALLLYAIRQPQLPRRRSLRIGPQRADPSSGSNSAESTPGSTSSASSPAVLWRKLLQQWIKGERFESRFSHGQPLRSPLHHAASNQKPEAGPYGRRAECA